MGFLRKLFGGDEEQEPVRQQPGGRGAPPQTADEQAVERYRYMLRTAPPEMIEQAHAEAFARLTPEQRRLALDELSQDAPSQERAAASDDPRSLARMATRAEVRQPGTLERKFGGVGQAGGGGMGMGMGGIIAGGLLASIAGSFVGTAIAQQFFDNDPGSADSDPGGGETSNASQDDPGTEPLAAEEPAFDDAGFDPDDDFGGDMGL